MISKLVLLTPAARWKIASLTRLLSVWRWFKRGALVAGAAFSMLLLIQLLYPRQLVRPFVHLDAASVGGWSSNRLKNYLNASAKQPYNLAIAGRDYKLSAAAFGISPNSSATIAAATRYPLTERLVPFSLFTHKRLTEQKTINKAALSAGLQKFADQRAQDPENATLTKQNGVYSTVVPGKFGYVVNIKLLQTRLSAVPLGSHLTVPRIAVSPKITQSMLANALSTWRQQTGRPIMLQLGSQLVTIPTATLETWAAVAPNEKQDAVFVAYDTGAIKSWLSSYAPRVYVAPQTATRYVVDDAVTQTVTGANGTRLDVDKSADAVVSVLKGQGFPVRLASASLQPVAFSTREVRSYSATSKGLQTLINDWAAHYKAGSVAASFQEIGGQSRSAWLNDNGQFFTASIYKLFVVNYAYHLIETNQLSPSTLVLATGKSVDACLEATIVVSDNACPEALGDQLGWINISAYAQQQGFTATSFVNHQWSTDTHDVMAYLNKLNAGALMNGADTAALLDKMQRQVYRIAIPAGSVGSPVQDKVGFYGSYWHDAAIVHTPKATYVLVIFTNGPGVTAIRSLAASVQQTINQ